MDPGRLRTGELVAGSAGLVLLLSMFLVPWFGVEVPAGTVPFDGFNAFQAFGFADLLLLLIALMAIALPLVSVAQDRTNIPIALSAFVTLAGFLAVAIVAFRLAIPPDLSGDRLALDAQAFDSFAKTRDVGVFLGLASSVAIAAGGWLAMRDDGTG